MPKVRATFYVESDLLEASRNAAFHLGGYPAHLTLTKLVEQALRTEILRLQQQYHQGLPFPDRGEELKGGRPLAA